jgi:ABC-type Zn uptake system ZnuABC Zn-binding protein ZnuA
MNKVRVLLVLCSLLVVSSSGGCIGNSKGTPTNESMSKTEAAAPTLKVVTSTTQLSTMTETIGGSHVAVTYIIPPKENPLNYSPSEEDRRILSSDDVFFLFDWNADKFARGVNASSINPHLQIVKITLANSWLVPAGQIELAGKITDALSYVDKRNETSYRSAAKDYTATVNDKEYSVITRLIRELPASTMTSPNVICAEPEKDFIEWMGLTVVATYNGAEPISQDEMSRLVEKGINGKVASVVDDLESGQDTGIELAREIDARRFILSSYPGGYDYAWSWADMVDTDVSLILRIGPNC